MRYSARRRRLYEKLRTRSRERIQERKHNRSRSRSRSLRRKQMKQRRGPEPRRTQRRQHVQTPNSSGRTSQMVRQTPPPPPPSNASNRRRTSRHVQARYTQSLQALQPQEPVKHHHPTINLSVFGYLVSDRNTKRHRSLRAAVEREGYDPVFNRLDYLATKYQDRGNPGEVLQQDVEWLEKYKERLDHRKLILEERTQTKKKRLRSLSRKRERSLERRGGRGSRRKPAVQTRGNRRKVY
jgi:hypothetical protein